MNLLRRILNRYFSLRTNPIDQADTLARIKADASFRGANLWVLIFAIFVASLGLNVNSTAVIIGAMLISPLMGPIVGMGMAAGIGDLELLKTSAKNFTVATVASVATAALYFLLSPYNEVQSELLARTSPTLFDVLIAFFGGAAGIVAIATGGKGNVIPGVAIATALMPPLCTAGFGIANGQWLYFLGAFYLFFINTVFIATATFIGARLMGFSRNLGEQDQRSRRARHILMIVVILTMVPAGILTLSLVRKSIFNQNLNRYVGEQLAWSGTQVISQHVDRDAKLLRVALIGHTVTQEQIAAAEQQLPEYRLQDYHLNVIQGTQSDSLLNLVGELESKRMDYKQTALQQSQQIHELETALDGYQRYEVLSATLRPELQVLFPQIRSLSLARTMMQHPDTALATPVVVALTELAPKERMTSEQTQKLAQWLRARTDADSLEVTFK